MHAPLTPSRVPRSFGLPQPLKVVVLCPLEFERKVFRRFAKLPAVTIGIGADAVRRAFADRTNWPHANPSLVVLLGTAGALTAKYHAGSDAVALEIRSIDGRSLRSSVGANAGAIIVESPTIVATPDAKAALARATNADLVDMECFTFASCAEAAGLRWAVVRGVSDDCTSEFPNDCADFFDARGHTRIGRVLAAIARSPSLFFTLLEITRDAKLALRNAAFTADALGCVDAVDLCDSTHPLLLYGGSFDPPHARHASLLGEAMCALHSPCAVVIPAAINPLKTATPPSPANARVAMCEAAFDDAQTSNASQVRVSEIEVAREGPSYSIDTVRTLLAERPHLRGGLRLLMGSDAIRTIEQWRDCRELLALAPPAIVVRPPDSAQSVTQFLREFSERTGILDAQSWLLPLDPIEHSSTSLREKLARGERPLGLSDGTWREISARGLYGVVRARG